MTKTRKNSATQPKPPGSIAVRNVNSIVYTEVNEDYGNGKIRCKSLVVDGTKYRTRLTKKFENRRVWENPDPRKITSGIPGTIVKLYVKEGQEVSEGDQMLILEAMKMKNRIMFRTSGTVKKIHVREGEKIPRNFLMLELT